MIQYHGSCRTGNYIDRSGGPAISLTENTHDFAITGNMIYRSGKLNGLPLIITKALISGLRIVPV